MCVRVCSVSLALNVSLFPLAISHLHSTVDCRLAWARCRKLSRCHCNTHLIRLVARLHWWFIVLLLPAPLPLLLLPVPAPACCSPLLFLLFLSLLLQAACRANPKQLVSPSAPPSRSVVAAAKQLTLMDHGNFFAFFHCAIPAVRVNWQK